MLEDASTNQCEDLYRRQKKITENKIIDFLFCGYMDASPRIHDFTVDISAIDSSKNRANYVLYVDVPESGILPLPGITNPPTDPDGDGLFEDLNANGFADWDDAVVLFWNTDWIQENEPVVSIFDFNHNGFIDWDDAVVLFWEV